MRFEWDVDKSQRNLRKHKVSFETARLVFDDPWQLNVQDRVVDGEERWQTLGIVAGILFLVAHTWQDDGGDEVIRLISAREATAREKQEYTKAQQSPSR